jgi:hypothetical protein
MFTSRLLNLSFSSSKADRHHDSGQSRSSAMGGQRTVLVVLRSYVPRQVSLSAWRWQP